VKESRLFWLYAMAEATMAGKPPAGLGEHTASCACAEDQAVAGRHNLTSRRASFFRGRSAGQARRCFANRPVAAADKVSTPASGNAMRHAPSTLHFSHAFGTSAPAGAIEWEELPSLAASLADRLVILGNRRIGAAAAAATRVHSSGLAATAGSPWDSTRPAELETSVVSAPFREPLQGVAIREVNEPDVFRHFFGA
jgi:hypothetical protein